MPVFTRNVHALDVAIGSKIADRLSPLQNALHHGASPPAPAPAPAPPPAPAPAPVAQSKPALCIVEYYQLVTVAGDIGVTRNIVKTIPVPGNSKQTTFVKTRREVTAKDTVSSSVLETRDQSSAKALSNSVNTASEHSHDTDRSDWKFDSSFHGAVNIGVTEDSVNADLHASGSSNEVRDTYRDAVDQAVNTQVSQTESSRKQSAETVGSDNIDTKENESIDTFELNNLGNPESLNFMLCQLSMERLTALCLMTVKLGFFDAKAKEFRVVPLSSMDTLIGEAIAEPEKRALVKDAIIRQTEFVFDYRDTPTAFVEKELTPIGATGETREFYRVRQDISTEVTVERSDGRKKTFHVQGIAIKSKYSVLPLSQFGIVRGAAAV